MILPIQLMLIFLYFSVLGTRGGEGCLVVKEYKHIVKTRACELRFVKQTCRIFLIWTCLLAFNLKFKYHVKCTVTARLYLVCCTWKSIQLSALIYWIIYFDWFRLRNVGVISELVKYCHQYLIKSICAKTEQT